MNAEIKEIFKNFTVDNVSIPVSFLFYDGNKDTYVVFMEWDKDNSYGADDEIAGYVTYYDFEIYSKKNYLNIVAAIKEKMSAAGWTYQPRRDSPDRYDKDTGYYSKTLCFAYPIQT